MLLLPPVSLLGDVILFDPRDQIGYENGKGGSEYMYQRKMGTVTVEVEVVKCRAVALALRW